VAGYYEGLLRFLDTSVAHGFLDAAHRETLLVDTDPARLLDRLWAGRGEAADDYSRI
jgi:hypothetical protein